MHAEKSLQLMNPYYPRAPDFPQTLSSKSRDSKVLDTLC